MKQGHFFLFFFLILLLCFFSVYTEAVRYEKVRDSKETIENSLLEAVEQAARQLRAEIFQSRERKQYVLEKVFFETWFTKLGIAGDDLEQERMRLLLPMIAYLDENGGSFLYTEYEEGSLKKQWSGFIGYEMMPADKETVITYLEKQTHRILTEHNRIAKQFDITYDFFVPDFLADTEELTFPMVVVVFQGYPLVGNGTVFYTNCLSSSVFLKSAELFCIETGTPGRYHKETCDTLEEREYEMVTESEAIHKYGAFPCPECLSEIVW